RSIHGLRFCMSGSAPLTRQLSDRFHRLTGMSILEGYGLSEASPVTHCGPTHQPTNPGTIGVPLPQTEVRIVDAETGTRDLPSGEVGEMIIRGPQVMAGYLDEPEETRQSLRKGWLFTGDLAVCDEEGCFSIVDRKKDMILSGGLNVYPTEIEAVLRTHPDVADCAVVGEPHDQFGERPVAHVVLVRGAVFDAEALEAHCRESLASYKTPRVYRPCDALPETFLGKIRRVELRKRAA
ncbi:MAG: AMP-binding protein, partial [Planctomycetales bacterium]